MIRRLARILGVLLEAAYFGAGLVLFATGTPGGMTLGLLFLGGMILLACARSACQDLQAIRRAVVLDDLNKLERELPSSCREDA